MSGSKQPVTAGVDTHGDTHHAAVVDSVGRHLADREFPATPSGYRRLVAWLMAAGDVQRVGVEGTGTYGAALTRLLCQHELEVVEVDRPDRKLRRQKGKSDPTDAYAAALAALSGRATATPKARTGAVESIRALRVVRRSAVEARTQTINQLKALLVTAPAELREQLRGLSAGALIRTCVRLRPGADAVDPGTSTKMALRMLARRYEALTAEIAEVDKTLAALVKTVAPKLLEAPGVGVEVAGQLLVTAGDNPERLRSEASFAHLCGAAPLPASSGRTDRHRLNRGGDRAANNAPYTIVLSRLRHHEPTQAYARRRRAQGLSSREIIRCLKRYVAREIHQTLTATSTPVRWRP
jgi:transposase